MRISLQPSGRRTRAFTLSNMLVASTLFLILMTGVLSTHLFGLSMLSLINPKLGGADTTRKVMNRLTADVHGASSILVGESMGTTFTEPANGTARTGRAIQIVPASGAATITYYLDTNDLSLKRIAVGDPSARILAKSLKNLKIFRQTDILGNTLSNRQSRFLVEATLTYTQVANSVIGTGREYDKCVYISSIASRSNQ